MKKIIFFFGLLILNNTYADIPTSEFAECSSKKGDLDKIECFDNLAKKYCDSNNAIHCLNIPSLDKTKNNENDRHYNNVGAEYVTNIIRDYMEDINF